MKYLIHLEQGNDEYFFVVGRAAWDWIHAPKPEFDENHRATELVPALVKAEFKFPEDVEDACEVTSGSFENDRVLHLLEGYSHHYRRPKGTYADTYDGFVY
jgi:hypothetical protein